MTSTSLTRVLAWPVADPKRQRHLAMDDWPVRGLTLCQLPVKGEPTAHEVGTTDCQRCRERGRQLEVNSGENHLVPTGYGIDPVDGSTTAERAERRRSE